MKFFLLTFCSLQMISCCVPPQEVVSQEEIKSMKKCSVGDVLIADLKKDKEERVYFFPHGEACV